MCHTYSCNMCLATCVTHPRTIFLGLGVASAHVSNGLCVCLRWRMRMFEVACAQVSSGVYSCVKANELDRLLFVRKTSSCQVAQFRVAYAHVSLAECSWGWEWLLLMFQMASAHV